MFEVEELRTAYIVNTHIDKDTSRLSGECDKESSRVLLIEAVRLDSVNVA